MNRCFYSFQSASGYDLVMTESAPNHKPRWLKLDAETIEADIAYFEAQIAFAGNDVETAYKQAQIKTYTALKEQMEAVLEGMKKGSR